MPAMGKHAPFHLWILIVAWVLQLIFLLIEIGIYIVAIIALQNASNEVSLNYSGIGFGIALVALCILMNVTEIIMCGTLRLTALYYLISNVIKSIIWVALVIIALVRNQGYTEVSGDYSSAYIGVGIGLSVCMMLLFLIPMIYGAIMYHKYGRRSAQTYGVESNSLQARPYVYGGAAIPRPGFPDLQDGQGHGFQKQSIM